MFIVLEFDVLFVGDFLLYGGVFGFLIVFIFVNFVGFFLCVFFYLLIRFNDFLFFVYSFFLSFLCLWVGNLIFD